MKKPLIAALIAILPLSLIAAEQAVRPDVQELMTVMKMDKQMSESMEAMKKMMLGNIPPGNEQALAAANSAFEKIAKEMSFEKMKGDLGQVYAEIFTPEEISGLIAFYKSPTGQAFASKQSLMTQKIMQLTQRKAMEAMSKP